MRDQMGKAEKEGTTVIWDESRAQKFLTVLELHTADPCPNVLLGPLLSPEKFLLN